MTGNELLRKIKQLAKKNGVAVERKKSRGKGSHTTLIYGDKYTIIPDLKKDIKKGTLSGILKALDIDELEL